MEAIRQNYETKNSYENQVDKTTETYKKSVKDTLNKSATEQLSDIFGLTKEQTEKLSNENELNTTEVQLAKMFNKYPEMLKLQNGPISLSSVMDQLEEYENKL